MHPRKSARKKWSLYTCRCVFGVFSVKVTLQKRFFFVVYIYFSEYKNGTLKTHPCINNTQVYVGVSTQVHRRNNKTKKQRCSFPQSECSPILFFEFANGLNRLNVLRLYHPGLDRSNSVATDPSTFQRLCVRLKIVCPTCMRFLVRILQITPTQGKFGVQFLGRRYEYSTIPDIACNSVRLMRCCAMRWLQQ